MSRDPLVQFLERRDQASFASLVGRSRDDVLRAAYRVLGDRDAAEDVTQDVFLKCLNPPWEAGEVRSGPALLAATAVNLAKMRVRGEVRRRAREETASERRDGLDEGLGRDEIEHVRFAVDSLPEGLRRPVELRYFGGLQLAELARALDVSLSTAKQRLAEARVLLRKQLADSRYGVTLAYVATESDLSGVADPQPSSDFMAQLDRLASEGVELSRIAAEPVRTWKDRYGHRWNAPAAIGALVLALGGVLWAIATDDDTPGAAVATLPEAAPDSDEDVSPGSDERRRVTVDPAAAAQPVKAAEDELPDRADVGATEVDEAGTISLAVEVVDEAGNLMREGDALLDLAGFPGFAAMEKLARWESFLDPQPLAKANPVIIEGLPDFADDIEIEAGARVPGFAPARPRTTVLKVGKRATIRVVVFRESESALTVVDRETGEPVVAAEVVFLTELERRDIDEDAPQSAPGPGYGITDSAGRVVVGGLGEGPHEVEVRAQGYLARVLDDVALRAERTIEIEPLREAATIVVEVLAPDGKPALEQRVNLRISGRDTKIVKTVDAAGRCRFEEVPPGHHVVMLEIEDWVMRMVDGETTSDETAITETLELEAGEERFVQLGSLPAAAPMTVDVVGPDGKPRAGVRVDVYGPLLVDGTTDDEGRVVFPKLAAGAYSVHVQLGDDDSTEWTIRRDVDVATGVPAHLRAVVGDRRVSGRVVLDASGEGVPRVMVFATDDQGRTLMVWGDREGRFSLGGALARQVRVSFAAGGDLMTETVNVPIHGATDPDPLTIRLRVGGSLRVHPRAEDSATYQLRLEDPDYREASAQGDGTHTLRGLPAGTWTLEVVRDGEVAERHQVTIAVKSETLLDLR